MKIRMPKLQVTESEDRAQATIVVEPLDKGLGHTLGNAMRRMLLSDLPGVAAVGVRIPGVMHEFSTIPGVAEDVVEIVLNLKGLCFRANTDTPMWEDGELFAARLEKEGPGPVFGKDLDCGEFLTVADPDHLICTLGKGGKITMEITVGKGRGYREATANKRDDAPCDYIPIDSIFTPVRSVSYSVEDARIGQDINYDRLTLDVRTNGTISARDVVSLAAKILSDHTALFVALSDEIERMEPCLERDEEETKERFDAMPIEELDFSVRAYNCLKRAGIHSVGELLAMTEAQLMKLRNFGNNSLAEVKSKLEERGMSLSDRDDPEERR